MKIDSVLELVKAFADSDELSLIQKSYDLLCRSVADQPKAIAYPLVNEAVAAAHILAELDTSTDSIAATILVNIPQEMVSPEKIGEETTPDIAALVTGVRGMRQLPYLYSENKLAWSDKKRSELYHAFVASLETPQWIMIELSHQLYRLRNLREFFSPVQREIVFDALEIYAPLAHRLGIWRIKWELEDLAFSYTNADDYQRIAGLLSNRQARREQDVEKVIERLREQLDSVGIEAEISGRPKHIYSIYKKMQRKGVPIEAVYDIRGLRVLVDNPGDCYQVLSIVHRIWTPIKDQLDDYIANPKPNGYQSLHTAVIDEDGRSFEVQIRTVSMHQDAELGVAAHWRYKEQNGSRRSGRKKRYLAAEHAIEEKISWLRMLLDESVEIGIEQPWSLERETEPAEKPIFAFTPAGDVIRLPAGATPIDFAYRIHTELGHRCSGAKVNGEIVSLDHQLHNGDRVEIITRHRSGPNIQWLSKDQRFIKTRDARRKVNAWFREQAREKYVARGHEIIDRELAKLGLKSTLSFDQVANLLNLENSGELLALVGSGKISTEKLISTLTTQPRPSRDELGREAEKELVTDSDATKTLIDKEAQEPRKPTKSEGAGLLVASTDGLFSKLARCCYPLPPEKIVGYVTRGYGATIHRSDCPNILSVKEPERIVPASWGEYEKGQYPVLIQVEAVNRRGLMGDIGQSVAQENVDIREAKVQKKAHWAVFDLILEVADANQLGRVLKKLSETKGVRQVFRKMG